MSEPEAKNEPDEETSISESEDEEHEPVTHYGEADLVIDTDIGSED